MPIPFRRRRAARAWLLATAALVAAACSDDDDPAAPEPVALAGTYAFAADLTITGTPATCDVSGPLTITQNGATFSATGPLSAECIGFAEQSGTATITGGQINGNQLSFSWSFPLSTGNMSCQLTGSVTGDPATSGSGPLNCTHTPTGSSGIAFSASGTWTATRT